MKKTLALSAVLILGVLGAACPNNVGVPADNGRDVYLNKTWKIIDVRFYHSTPQRIVIENLSDSSERRKIFICTDDEDQQLLVVDDKIKITFANTNRCSFKIERIK